MPHVQIPLIQDQGIPGLFTNQGDSISNVGVTRYPFMLNGYFEQTGSGTDSRKVAYVKRPGFGNFAVASTFGNNYKIQGISVLPTRDVITIFTNNGTTNNTWVFTVAAGLVSKGIAPAAAGAWTATGAVVYTNLDGISYGANNYWAVTDFTKGATVTNAGVWTEITNANFTGLTKCTNFVALDGYLFIGTTNNRIYNCDLNIPATWQATSFLTCADTPGNLLWLGRIRNYLIAFKERSIEFFEDVGNPTPGSPLQAIKQYNRTIGCINKSTIQEVSDGIIFAGVGSGAGAAKIYKIMKDTLQIVEISDRYIELCLDESGFTGAPATSYTVDPIVAGAISNQNSGQSMVFHILEKEFYGVHLVNPNGDQRYLQVYDNDLKLWTTFATSYNSAGTVDTDGFIGSQAAVFNFSASNTCIMVNNKISNASTPPRIEIFSSNHAGGTPYGDNVSNPFPFVWTSDIQDFGNRKRKFQTSLEVAYDIDQTAVPSVTASTNMTLGYRDYDYNMNSGYLATRTIPLDPGGGVRAIVRRLGSFRRRAYTLLYNDVLPMRIWDMEITYQEGDTEA